jgi:hypothetical protein
MFSQWMKVRSFAKNSFGSICATFVIATLLVMLLSQ